MMKFNLLVVFLLASVLTACGVGAQTPTPLPTVVLGGNGPVPSQNASTQVSPSVQGNTGGATASGFVIPAQEAHLAFTIGGNVRTVKVSLGDPVKAGQVLAELDNAVLQAQVDQAGRDLKALTSPAGIAAAEQDFASAQKALKDAQDKADSLFYPRASDSLIQNTQGQINLTKQQLTRTADTYRQLSRLANDDGRKAAALVAMTNAQLTLNRLIAQYNWYAGKPTDIDAAMVQANLDAAKAGLQEAQWYLSAVKGEQYPPEATGIKLSGFANARDNLAAAQERLDGTRLIAPFAGTVSAVHLVVGDYVSPGVILMVVSDINRLQVQTTDLSERDVPRVKVGQSVTVSVKALNQNVAGHVTILSPVADTLGGDVVYQTIIDLDLPLPDGLRAGMSVDVQFDTGQ
jgi:multidrug efflux pump subunit AcrA (membrane-fusion protein)